MSKEIKDLLEKMQKQNWLAQECGPASEICSKKVGEYINQALTKLREAPEPTEFTKIVRKDIKDTTPNLYASIIWETCHVIDRQAEQEKRDMETIGQLDKINKQLQAHLDRAEASKADLLAVCKELIENEPHGITSYFDEALRKIEDILAKEKEG